MAALRTISRYRRLIEKLPEFRVLSPPLTETVIDRVGFPADRGEGTAVVPAVVGPSTEFNARGKEVVRKDLPMETRSRMIHTSWEDWHGQTHSGTQYRDYDAYPREQIPPPGEYLTLVRRDGERFAASRSIRNDEPEEQIVNILNVVLELFDELAITHPDLRSALEVRQVNWKILPPGKYPYERAADALREYVGRLPSKDREVADHRIRAITRHEPDFVAVGIGGFSDYVVFGFTDRNRYVLESPYLGNATYVFRNDWEQVSGLSKAEIIEGSLHEARLIHNDKWQRQLREVIQRA